ncbi:MAG: hypothetical protein ACM3UZ_07615 [Acidobacteriota bacterium]
MTVPVIAGQPAFVWGGLTLLALLFFQVLTGRQIIKVPFTWHRINALLIIVIAIGHAVMALGVRFWGFKIG